jgi:hypothetical protein
LTASGVDFALCKVICRFVSPQYVLAYGLAGTMILD